MSQIPNFSSLLIDWLGFTGTFSTNRLYRAFDKYGAVKKVKLMRKLTIYVLMMYRIVDFYYPAGAG